MKQDWELLGEGPDDASPGPPAWWKVHVPTFLGSLVMSTGALVALSGAVGDGGWRAWTVALGFTTNAVALLGVARSRHMMRTMEGGDRRFARVSELGPWGRREWWLTLVAFAGFVVAIGTILLS